MLQLPASEIMPGSVTPSDARTLIGRDYAVFALFGAWGRLYSDDSDLMEAASAASPSGMFG